LSENKEGSTDPFFISVCCRFFLCDILSREVIGMKLVEWLSNGDPVIKKLVERHLLDHDVLNKDEGYIHRYLVLFDWKRNRWSGSVYSPKWISTHYTMMELKYMEVPPDNPEYTSGVETLISGMWEKPGMYGKYPDQDLCVVAMILGMASYVRFRDERLHDMVDYILAHCFPDGGWNCNWNSVTHPASKSSLHTTISVLEAFRDYLKNGYEYRREEVLTSIFSAEDFVLRKHLFRSERTGEIIHKAMIECHYPERWHYDLFRGLEYFQSVQKPYEERMNEALDIVEAKFGRKGYLTKGPFYPGLVHFDLETSRAGRFATLKALKILKFYRRSVFDILMDAEIGDPK